MREKKTFLLRLGYLSLEIRNTRSVFVALRMVFGREY